MEAVAYSDNGLFRGGKSATVAFTFACGAFECGVGVTEQTVQLSTNKKSCVAGSVCRARFGGARHTPVHPGRQPCSVAVMAVEVSRL